MGENKTPAEMIGDFIREAAVLLAVFMPLDAALANRLTFDTVGLTLVVSGALLGLGMWVEVRRQ